MKNSMVLGVGHYVPQNVVTNADLEKMMETSNEWIVERTGIMERRWARPGEETIAGMATKAARIALDRAATDADEIEFIVFASILGDKGFPGGGCLMEAELGIPGVPAMDIRNACSGFVYALSVADKFIKTGTYRKVLVVGAEIQNTALDKTTRGRDVSVLFADGAGAVVLGATDDSGKGVLTTHLHADGSQAEILKMDWPSIHRTPPIYPHVEDIPMNFPEMQGRQVFKNAVTRFPEVIQEALDATGYSVDDIDLVIPHQANQRISEAVAKRMKIPWEKVFSNIHKYGNTTAASIPIATSEAWESGKIKEGDLICMAAFGAGLTWGSALIRW